MRSEKQSQKSSTSMEERRTFRLYVYFIRYFKLIYSLGNDLSPLAEYRNFHIFSTLHSSLREGVKKINEMIQSIFSLQDGLWPEMKRFFSLWLIWGRSIRMENSIYNFFYTIFYCNYAGDRGL